MSRSALGFLKGAVKRAADDNGGLLRQTALGVGTGAGAAGGFIGGTAIRNRIVAKALIDKLLSGAGKMELPLKAKLSLALPAVLAGLGGTYAYNGVNALFPSPKK